MKIRTNIFTTLGAVGHSIEDREVNDFYATEPKAVKKILQVETPSDIIWECACGEGHISKELERNGYQVISTDLIYRGYGKGNINFLEQECCPVSGCDIITNPPYKLSMEFVLKALDVIDEGHKCYMFLKLQFLEGQKRYQKLFSKYPPKKIYVFSERINCAKNGEFDKYPSSAVAYAWFVWEKGWAGKTSIEWI